MMKALTSSPATLFFSPTATAACTAGCLQRTALLAEDGFDLLRVDVEAADDDDVGRAVYDFYVSVLVDAHDVAGVEPAVGREAFARVLFVAEVAAHDRGAFEVEDAFVVEADFVAFAVAYLYFVVIEGGADRAELFRRLGAVDCDDGAALCEAVALEYPDAEVLAAAALHLDVEAVAARDDEVDALNALAAFF